MMSKSKKMVNFSPPKMKWNPHAARAHRGGSRTRPFMRCRNPSNSLLNTSRLKWPQISAQTYSPHRSRPPCKSLSYPSQLQVPNPQDFSRSSFSEFQKFPNLCLGDSGSEEPFCDESDQGTPGPWSSCLDPNDPNPRLATNVFIKPNHRGYFPSHGPVYENTKSYDEVHTSKSMGGPGGLSGSSRLRSCSEKGSGIRRKSGKTGILGTGSNFRIWSSSPEPGPNLTDSQNFLYNEGAVQGSGARLVDGLMPLNGRLAGELDQMAANFRARPGDIIILQCERRAEFPHVGGHVALYSDDNFFRTLVQDQSTLGFRHTHEFAKGDIVIRMGYFDQNWKWHLREVEVFVCEHKNQWRMVGKVATAKSLALKMGNQIPCNSLDLPPHGRSSENEEGIRWPDPCWEHTFPNKPSSNGFGLSDQQQTTIPFQDIYFKPKEGDLIINGVPGLGEENLKKWEICWWHEGLETKPFDMVVRADFKAQRKPHCQNVTEMTVEMYWLYDTLRYWTFVGKAAFVYATHRPALAYPAPRLITRERARRWHGSSGFHDYDDAWHSGQGSTGWRRVQDIIKRKMNRTFTNECQEPGMQRRVLDQPYDHHLPRDYDHLGFDDRTIA